MTADEFDPDKVWGADGWLVHEGCPDAAVAGQDRATHSKAFHRRGPPPGVLHAHRETHDD